MQKAETSDSMVDLPRRKRWVMLVYNLSRSRFQAYGALNHAYFRGFGPMESN
jgi:hypothetical protein